MEWTSYKEHMFACVHSTQEEGWWPEGDTIAIYTSPAFKQREQEGMILPSDRIVRTRRVQCLEAENLMTGIKNKDY